MLKIQNLSVSYGSRRILHDVSLEVQSGEVLALIGPNGAGKSTLIRAASGVIPYTGHVRTNGDDFASLTPIQRAQYIATVPQAVSIAARLHCLGNCPAWAHTVSWISRSAFAKG